MDIMLFERVFMMNTIEYIALNCFNVKLLLSFDPFSFVYTYEHQISAYPGKEWSDKNREFGLWL